MSPLSAQNFELLYSMLFVAACATGFGYLFYRLDRMVRQKGHQSPWRATGFTVAYFAGLVLGFLADGSDPASCYSCSPAANPDYFQEAFIWPHVRRFMGNFFPPIAVMFVLAAIAAKLVPAHKRRPGARTSRIPWQGLATLATVAGFAGVAAAWYFDLGFSALFRIGVVFAGLRGVFAYNARRFAAPSMANVLDEDARAPVFYLRAFDREDQMFTAVSLDQLGKLKIPVRNPQAFRHAVTLEEFLAVTIRREVGPFIALGDPNDAIPPGGAARDYIDDTTWQDKFRSLADRSAFIIMGPERSDNLSWELSHLRESNMQTKLFVVTSPPITALTQRMTWGINRSRKIWPEFENAAKEARLFAGDFPGMGAVLTFDSEGRAVKVAGEAQTPEDYVRAIVGYLGGSVRAAASGE